ncbi:MAG: tetratricopeptide repeat protein [Defluviitaleaceae bacterium]|nr:tetratricopeptide repeat protein [Defluviitaleaceae bacterium]MCL2262825.1 tetratricopeptide repeat protein [Defluviitaleaceae bacterium]
MSAQSENPNAEAHWQMRDILETANRGFYIITAPPLMQPDIAAQYLSLPPTAQDKNIAMYNYAENTAPFSFGTLSKWVEENDSAGVYFLLNMQLAFPLEDEDAMYQLNMCRDLLASHNKVWFFFMSRELEKRLNLTALDFYDYVRVKVHFEGEEHTAPQLGLLDSFDDSTDFIPEETAKALLTQYGDMEKELMALPLEGTDENQLRSAANTLTNIANVYEESGQYQYALQLYEKVKSIHEVLFCEDHPETAASYSNIAAMYDELGNHEKALELKLKALIITVEHSGKESDKVAMYYNNIAFSYRYMGDNENALRYNKQSMEIRKKIYGYWHPRTATSYANIASVYNALYDHGRALKYSQKALEIREKKLGNSHPLTAYSYNGIAHTYSALGEYTIALEFSLKSYIALIKTWGDAHPKTKLMKKNLEMDYTAAGHTAPFEEWLSSQLLRG